MHPADLGGFILRRIVEHNGIPAEDTTTSCSYLDADRTDPCQRARAREEAFALVPMAWLMEIDCRTSASIQMAVAFRLGHSIGATGARIMTALLNELERTIGRYVLLTKCENGVAANVTIIERID
jgi:hypothetical protein